MTRIFLAGGAGVRRLELISRLAAAGHDVIATTRHAERRPLLAALGASGVVVDVDDADRLCEAVGETSPEVVVHELTELCEAEAAATSRDQCIRAANLVAAARLAGVPRIIVESVASAFPDGASAAREDDPITPGAAASVIENLGARLPHTTILRYGRIYGPGTWYAPGSEIAEHVRVGHLRATAAITAFVHIDDAVTATLQSLGWPDGTCNIVDDEPAPGTAWLPVYAASLGAPAPRAAGSDDRTALGRPVANAKARAAGWQLKYPSWRTGFNAL